MRRKVLSDVELRSRHAEDERLVVEDGTIITPAAMDYIRQHGIELETGKKKQDIASFPRILSLIYFTKVSLVNGMASCMRFVSLTRIA